MKGNILLIDSGVGGLSTLKCIKELLPNEDYVYYADNKNIPYGDKTADFFVKNTQRILDEVSTEFVLKLVVFACNTLTGMAIKTVRIQNPHLEIVGMEPAWKTALTKGGKTLILCTENTSVALRKRGRTDGYTVVKALPELACLIEQEVSDDDLKGYLKKNLENETFDNLVLGCTHYCLKKRLFCELFPQAAVFDGNDGVARRVKSLLSEKNMLNNKFSVPSTVLLMSGSDAEMGKYIRLMKQNF